MLEEGLQLARHCLCGSPSQDTHLIGSLLMIQDDQDLVFLADISTGKSLPMIKYQLKTLLKQESRPKWSPEEDKILYQILAV